MAVCIFSLIFVCNIKRCRKMKQKLRQKREGIGMIAIFCFFILVFLYLRMVMSHAKDIRKRRESHQQKDGGGGVNDDDDDSVADENRLIAEDEVEGGFGIEWRMLRRHRDRGVDTKKVGDSTIRAKDPVLPTTHIAESTSRLSTQSPSQAPSTAAAHATPTKPPINIDARLHVEPLTDAHRRYWTESHVAMEEGGVDMMDLYRDVQEHVKDETFFSANRHIFGDTPELITLLKKWQTLNLGMRSGTIPKRFVVVHPVGQLCNRLMAITSAAWFAILTKRGLVVDDSGFYAQHADLFNDPGFPIIMSDYSLQGAAGYYIANPDSGVWVDTEKLLCGDFEHVYSSDHIDMAVNQYLVPYMANNPKYRPALARILRGNMDLFFPMSHFLFRPVPSLIAMRDEFVQKHFSGKFVVGLQVRSGGDFTDHFMSNEDWELYRSCAEALVPTRRDERDIVFFLATDTEEGRTAGKRELEKISQWWNTTFLDGPSHHPVVVSTPQFLLSNYPEGVRMALLDLLLLAAADDRVSTAWSSYGYFSAGYAGVHSAMVVDKVPESDIIAAPGAEQRFMGIPHKSDRRRQCVRLTTHQPCFHKFESWGASRASCFSKDMMEREMLHGRYC